MKNQEEKIEGFLRSIIFKILYGKEENIKNIIVADLKSQDKTKEIAKKGKVEYTAKCRAYALENFRKEDRYADYLKLYENITVR